MYSGHPMEFKPEVEKWIRLKHLELQLDKIVPKFGAVQEQLQYLLGKEIDRKYEQLEKLIALGSCLKSKKKLQIRNMVQSIPSPSTCIRYLALPMFLIFVITLFFRNESLRTDGNSIVSNSDSTFTVPQPLPIAKPVPIPASQILNQPQWVESKSWNISEREFTEIGAKDFVGGSEDKEEELGWTNFFHGMSNGLMLELGAMDGKQSNKSSFSSFFEQKAGWKVILIEGSKEALEIPKNRPEVLSLQLAVCESKSTVHFVEGSDVGGILELMTPEYLKKYHSQFLKADYDKGRVIDGSDLAATKEILDLDKVKAAENVHEQLCYPLQAVFDHFGILRINFMVLDISGGELAALKSLEFRTIQFDVICVKTNRFGNETDPYIEEIVQFLNSKNYKLVKRMSGRNSWFVSSNCENNSICNF